MPTKLFLDPRSILAKNYSQKSQLSSSHPIVSLIVPVCDKLLKPTAFPEYSLSLPYLIVKCWSRKVVILGYISMTINFVLLILRVLESVK